MESFLSDMPSGIDVSTYDPIDEIKSVNGDSSSDQYKTAEKVDALAAQMQVVINLLI